jgi:RNase P/RNase MRP subunit POP5
MPDHTVRRKRTLLAVKIIDYAHTHSGDFDREIRKSPNRLQAQKETEIHEKSFLVKSLAGIRPILTASNSAKD